MAIKVSKQSGNWNTATTWGTGTELGTAYTTGVGLAATRYSDVFTAPDTTSQSLGALVYMYNIPVIKSYLVCTLQEYNGSSWVDKATVTYDETNLGKQRFYSSSGLTYMMLNFVFPTPYTYTTTTAGYYRFAFSRTAATAGVTYWASTTSTTTVYAFAVDDRNGVPASTDDVYLGGDINTEYVVVADGTCTCGSNTGVVATISSNNPNIPKALVHCFNGTLTFDETQDTTLTVSGCHFCSTGGGFHIGTLASPYPADKVAKVIYPPKDANYSLGSLLFNFDSAHPTAGKVSFVGSTKTSKTQYASGDGSTATPLVVDDATGWLVGDVLAFSGDAYNHKEYRYIKTIAGTSITLSATLGGVESALTYTHYVADWVLNLTRNIRFGTPADSNYWYLYTFSTHNNNLVYKNVEFSQVGGTTISRGSLIFTNNYRYTFNIDNCSFYTLSATTSGMTIPFVYTTYCVINPAITNSVSYYTDSSYYTGIINSALYSGNIDTWYHIGGKYEGISLYGLNTISKNIHSRNAMANYNSSTGFYGGIMFGGTNNIFENCTSDGNRSQGILLMTGANNLKFNNCNIGKVYSNLYSSIGVPIYGGFAQASFESCNFETTKPLFSYSIDVYGYFYLSDSSYISFGNSDGGSEHITYYPNGIITKTGAGLTDTTVRLSGGNCMRQESSITGLLLETPLSWEQKVPVGNIQNNAMTVGVWVKISSANYYGGTTYELPRITVDYDNGTTTYAEATASTDWQFLSVSITPTTIYPELTVSLSSMTDATTTDAYVYFTDVAVLYPAGVALTQGKLTDWVTGVPLTPTIATGLSASDVWAVGTSGLTGTGTIGKFVTKLLTVAKFIGLK